MFKLTVAILPTCSKIRREGLLDDENWEVGEFGRGEEKHIIRNWSALVGQFSKCDVYLGCWVVGIGLQSAKTHENMQPTLEKESVQFSLSVVSDSAAPWIAAHQASLSITNSRSSLKLMSIKLVKPSNHLTLCCLLLLLPSIFPNIRLFSNESVLYIRPKY